MAFRLPELNYRHDSLEPAIDARTMQIHHENHHGTYVKNLNAAIEPYPELARMNIEEMLGHLDRIPERIRTAVRNNGGGHYNHSLFWKIMGPGKGGTPAGHLASKISESFGTFDGFREAFKRAALGRFGSGWVWLTADEEGRLLVSSTANQDNPIMRGNHRVLMGLDVWEHAYYLTYQSRRAEYVDAWWQLVDWAEVANRYASSMRRPAETEEAARRHRRAA